MMSIEYAPALLVTKQTPPPLNSSIVSRPHLLACLDSGMAHQFTLLSAPAGFGKTTLLAEWLHHKQATADKPLCFAWVSLDTGDNDPHRFWRYIITAYQKHYSYNGLNHFQSLDPYRCSSIEPFIQGLINEFSAVKEPTVLILDNYHTISSPSIHNALALLLDHAPPTFHLILSTRADLPRSLVHYRTFHMVNEIHDSHLRFSRAEIRRCLTTKIAAQFIPDALDQLERITEGWIAGLQLTMLALRDTKDLQNFFETFNGSHPYIVNYLIKEVLNQQPEDWQTFLLESSLLEILTGSLCNVALDRNDSAQMLAQIEQANIFLKRVGQQSYRYHGLFAEAMQAYISLHFSPQQVFAIYHKASIWYEQHEYHIEAIEAALKANQYERAVQLIEYVIDHAENYQHLVYTFKNWQSWSKLFPKNIRIKQPILCLLDGFCLRVATKTHESTVQLQRAEHSWASEGNKHRLGLVYTLRAILEQWWNGQAGAAQQLAQQALALLANHTTIWSYICHYIIYRGYAQAGDTTIEWHWLEERFIYNQMARETAITMDYITVKGDMLFLQGQPEQAAEMYTKVLAEATNLPLIIKARIGLGNVYLAWNKHDVAELYLAPILELDLQEETNHLILHSFLPLARILRAVGRLEQANKLLQQTIALAQKYSLTELLSQTLAYQAWIALDNGHIDTALAWHSRCELQIDAAPCFKQEREYLILARVLIAQNETILALRLLQKWQELAQIQGRVRSELEIKILYSLAYYAQGELNNAVTTLMTALSFTNTENHVHLFVEEGIIMARLLQSLLVYKQAPHIITYAQNLLNAFPMEQQLLAQHDFLTIPNTAIRKSFTACELSVLRLLTQNLLNSEIAEQQMVSINTIKSQLKSIFSKLQVQNRKDAIKRAKELHLF